MKKIIPIFITLLCVVSILLSYTNTVHHTSKQKNSKNIDSLLNEKLQHYAAKQQSFIHHGHYNDSILFIFNLNEPSGKNRFYIYNIKDKVILCAGLAAHGSGKNNQSTLQLSNEIGSLCSSVGRYKIGKKYYGKFGLAYKLIGLDSTNSNALSRNIVLHSHSCVPAKEIYPNCICESWGCPTLSPVFLSELEPIIDNSTKPILLCIQQP